MKPFLIPFLILFLSFHLSTPQPDFRYSSCIDTYGNYTNTSTYAANLNTLLTSITSDTDITYGFYNFTAGNNSGVDRVNGIALCRPDVTLPVCKSCLSDAARKIRAVCPTQREAIGWYNECMIRYSNRSIFGSMDSSHEFGLCSVANATDPDNYDQQLGFLLRRLQSKAMEGDSRRKFGEGFAKVNDFENVYAFVECTPDLSASDCSNCIEMAINYVPSYCYGKRGALIGMPSCDIRFDFFQFYNSVDDDDYVSPSSSPPENSTTGSSTGKGTKGDKLVIAIVIPLVVCIVLAALIFCWCFSRRRKWEQVESSPSAHETEDSIKSTESLQFDFGTIRVATSNFSDANKLGRGGFGTVYKGMLSNGQQIAVKRLAMNSGQGEQEFKNEVLLVARLQHRNLVRLLGFCCHGKERLLIYEFVPNASLDHFLFDPVKRRFLDWRTRYKIIASIARGLLYLHEDSRLRIIHRDLKASNILLDAEMNPKISDFGTAKLFQIDQTQGDTNKIVGTYGYMAPEYALHGLFSVKSDVYSFGVLILEMITGRRSTDLHQGGNSGDLISHVWRNWREGSVMNIVDEIISSGSRSEIMRCIHIGLLCVQENAADRPTMSSVVVMLSSHSLTLSVPSHPAYITRTLVPLGKVSE